VVCLQKPKVLLGMLLLAVSLTLIAVIVSLQNTGPSSQENDFNLLFRHGVGAKNELNTFEGTYTKDMVLDPPITISLILSEEELEQIHQKMIEIDFFNYPEDFPPRLGFLVTPCTNYFIKVEHGSIVKEINWNENSMLESNIQGNLWQLVGCIMDIVEQKPEYKALPPARGGYL
jgi:hypothetical protein